MLIQGVFNIAHDSDSRTQTLKEASLFLGAHSQAHCSGAGVYPVANGDQHPTTIKMRPRAIKRWQVLDGSTDDQVQIQFMVVKGHYALDQRQAHWADVGTKSPGA